MSENNEQPVFVHIMLIGKELGHVTTAMSDMKFHPKPRVYLIHSPDDPDFHPFQTKAEELKKQIEESHTTEVTLEPIPKDGAFNQIETLKAISKIIQKELSPENKIVASQKFIAINITGGTNMMATAAMLAACLHKTSAYYVLDRRHRKNGKDGSFLVNIGVPFQIEQEQNKPELQQLLHLIYESTFDWPHEIKEKKYDSAKIITCTKCNGNHGEPGIKSDNSILETIWIKPRKLEGSIIQKNLEEKSGLANSTLRARLRTLESKGLIEVNSGIPQLSEHTPSDNTYVDEFRINRKENLIQITEYAEAYLLDYTP